MPSYMITDTHTGQKFKVTGDSPPTEAEAAQIFADMGGEKPTVLDKNYTTDKAKIEAGRRKFQQQEDLGPGGRKTVGDYIKEPARFLSEAGTYTANAGLEGLKSVASTVQGGGEAIRTGSLDAGLRKYAEKQAEFQPIQNPMNPSMAGEMIGEGFNKGVQGLSNLTGRPDIVQPVAEGAMKIAALAGLRGATKGVTLADLGRKATEPIANAAGTLAEKVNLTPEKLYASSLKQSTTIPIEQRAANVKTGLEGGYVPSKKGLNNLYEHISDLNGQIGDAIEGSTKPLDPKPLIDKIAAIDQAIGQETAKAGATANNTSLASHMVKTQGPQWMRQVAEPESTYLARLQKAHEALPPEAQMTAPEATGTSPKIAELEAAKSDLQGQIDTAAPVPKTVKVADILSRLDEVKQRAIDTFGNNQSVLRIIKGFEKSLQKHPSVVDGEIPVVVAQKLKVNTYRELKNSYGELKGFEIEAKKAMARGAKEEIVAQIPELADLNAKDSALINLEKVLFKAVNRIENRDVIGIGVPIKTIAGAMHGAGGAMLGAVLGLIDTPAIKAHIAIAMHKARGGKVSPREVNAYVDSIKATAQKGTENGPDSGTPPAEGTAGLGEMEGRAATGQAPGEQLPGDLRAPITPETAAGIRQTADAIDNVGVGKKGGNPLPKRHK